MLLASCTLSPTVNVESAKLAHVASHHEITATPFIEQDAYQCGPASLAMILQFYGDKAATPDALAPWTMAPNAKGSFPVEMDAVSRRQGFISYPISNLEAIIEEVNADHPILVLQNLGLPWFPKWHYAVIVGYNLNTQDIILRSGDQARRVTSFRLFETTWQRSDYWARVILPPTQIPVTAKPLIYLRAALDAQQTGASNTATVALTSASRQWPNEPSVWFSLANQFYQLAHYDQALTTFNTLLQRHPHYGPGWNNIAYTLKALSCHDQAIHAARCAQTLAPSDQSIIDTINELQSNTEYKSTKQCDFHLPCPFPVAAD